MGCGIADEFISEELGVNGSLEKLVVFAQGGRVGSGLMFFRWFLYSAMASAFFLAGCEKKAPKRASAPATYGEPSGTISTNIPRLRLPATNHAVWQNAPFACVQTELSPATLY